MIIVNIFNGETGEHSIRSYENIQSMQKIVLKMANLYSDKQRFMITIAYLPEKEENE